MAIPHENVAEEIQQEEIVQPQDAQITQEASQEQTEENSKEYNFRQLRETNKQLESRLRKSEEILESMSRSKLSSDENEEDLNIGEEDLVEGKHLKKVIARLEQKLQATEQAQIPDRLRGKYADFDQVVTRENLEKLQQAEPELYNTIRSGTDLFQKGVAAYKTLKSLGLIDEQETYMKNKETVQNNHKKPLSAQAIKGQGALHEANMFANGLTPELKKQLQKEMAEAAKAR